VEICAAVSVPWLTLQQDGVELLFRFAQVGRRRQEVEVVGEGAVLSKPFWIRKKPMRSLLPACRDRRLSDRHVVRVAKQQARVVIVPSALTW